MARQDSHTNPRLPAMNGITKGILARIVNTLRSHLIDKVTRNGDTTDLLTIITKLTHCWIQPSDFQT